MRFYRRVEALPPRLVCGIAEGDDRLAVLHRELIYPVIAFGSARPQAVDGGSEARHRLGQFGNQLFIQGLVRLNLAIALRAHDVDARPEQVERQLYVPWR